MAGDSLNNAPVTIVRQSLGGHGHDSRGLEAGAVPGMGYGRFGRMFRFAGRPLGDQVLQDIAEAMVKVDISPPITDPEPVDENPTIPAGYTYFGQLVDHDITFDPSPLSVDRMDVAALEDFRTPALDLDCLYGRGPDDQPYMYREDGLRLREGLGLTAGKGPKVHDVPRIPPAAGDAGPAQRAIIGDKRNDENRIVAQLQSAMIRLHNKIVSSQSIVEQFGGDFTDSQSRFRAAVNCVRWHYQWLVVHDFLDHRILAPGTIGEVLSPANVPTLRFYDKTDAKYAYIPVEFAGAAYRFGHSMVRPGYSLNADVLKSAPNPVAAGAEQDGRIPIFSRGGDPTQNLNGFGMPMPGNWGIDWSFFLPVPRGGNDAGFKLPQPSYRIDAMLVAPLADLPEFVKENEAKFRALAYRNLRRGTNVLGLPSGEQVAKAIGVTPLTSAQLWQGFGSGKPFPPALPKDDADTVTAILNRRGAVWTKWQQQLSGNTPLWYYILREAELLGIERQPADDHIAFGGQHLGPVGSALVAETFIGLLARDENSYLNRWPNFQPTLPKRGSLFDLADLITFANS